MGKPKAETARSLTRSGSGIMLQKGSGSPDPGQGPSRSLGLPWECHSAQHLTHGAVTGRESTAGWLHGSLATGNRSETEGEVLLMHRARFSL